MIQYLSLFSGIGAFESAMKNLNIPFNLVGFSEIDKYAVKSYCAIHNVPETLNLGDITKIDETQLPKVDFVTYGFPCQDISLAGKQQGLFNEDGSLTRSGLFFDALRLIAATKPKVAIAENVKNLTSKKFAEQFKIVLESLEEVGYNNYFKVLNSKDFGIPQNRERVFIVSIRKDCDTGVFEFPEPYPLKLRLKDMLDDTVDEKFYLSEKMTEYLHTITEKNKARGNGNIYKPCDVDGISKTITTKEGSRVKDNFIEEYGRISYDREFENTGDIASALCARDYKGMGRHKAINAVVEMNTDEVMQIGNCRPTKTRANPNQGKVYDTDGISPCLNTKGGGNLEPHVIKDLRIRKLTPKECFRLMGFKDEDFEKAEQVNSNTQLYKQAGNSIVVDVAEELLCMLFDEDGMLYI